MKALLVAYECDPLKGSEKGRSWNWAVNLAKIGYEATVLTNVWGKESIERRLKETGLTSVKFVFVEVPNWLENIYHKKHGVFVYLHYWFWLFQAAKTLKKMLKSGARFDVAQHVSWGSIQQGAILGYFNIPFIFGPVGGGQLAPEPLKKYFLHKWSTETKRKTISRILTAFNGAAKRSLRKAAITLVINEETYNLAKKLRAREVRYFLDTSMPEEAIPARLPQRLPDGEMKILWVGRLLPRKAVNLALEAFSRVDRNAAISLTIVGDGEFGHIVNPLIRRYGLEGKVRWTGQIPWQEVKDAYLRHDIFLFTSLRDSFGQQLIEAMTFGLPVVTLNHQGARAFVPENAGIKVDVENEHTTPQKIAEAIQFLYENPEKRKEFGKNSYDFALSQAWSKKLEQIKKMYEETANA